jgi:hypothetical protein
MKVFSIILFPLVFIITLPIEFPLWKTYKSEGYNVPNYLKFFWNRVMVLKQQNFKK